MAAGTLEKRRSRAARRWRSLRQSHRPVVYIGMGSCGLAAGAAETREAIETWLSETGHDVRIVEVGCIGPCYLEPLVDVQLPGRPRVTFPNLTADRAVKTVAAALAGETPKRAPVWWLPGGGPGVEDAEEAAATERPDLPDDVPAIAQHPMLAPQVRIVLRNCGVIDPDEVDHYLARDGYRGLERCLDLPWQEVIETVKEAGLRGRGGAGFPTWRKWQFCRDTESDQRYLICNADEGDPGAFMNRSLIEGDPHALLEGMLIAGYAIGASRGYIYIRAEYPLAIRRLHAAMDAMRELGLLGDRILGSDFSFDIVLKEGAGAFVCGEETALIASLEGKRGMPRTRPPFPAVAGLFGKPTIINNVETLSTLPAILRNGPAWYSRFGTETSRGTKTFSLVGKVRRTGVIEVPLGTTLRRVVEDIGGGARKDFKAVQTGGPSGGCLGEALLDTPIDYENLAAAGSIMGSGGLIVLDSDTCIVDTARFFLTFTQDESCGKCAPCRIGTGHLVDILDSVCKGEAEPEDLDRLEQLGLIMKRSSLCGLGQTAPNPVLSSLKYFREEFEDHLLRHRCRAAVCRDLVEFHIDPGNCVGCLRCVAVCPTGAISGPRAEPQSLDPDKCIKCRSCVDACRYDAISGDPVAVEAADAD